MPKFERTWKGVQNQLEGWKEITEDRAKRELAHAHGDNAIEKLMGLEKGRTLETRFAFYRCSE